MNASVRLHRGQRRFEVRDILLHRRRDPSRQWGRCTPGGTTVARRPIPDACGLGKISPIGPDGHCALSLKPGEAMSDIGRVADLALLAIVDDVHAGLHLLPHDIGDGAAHAGVEGRGIG